MECNRFNFGVKQIIGEGRVVVAVVGWLPPSNEGNKPTPPWRGARQCVAEQWSGKGPAEPRKGGDERHEGRFKKKRGWQSGKGYRPKEKYHKKSVYKLLE